MAGLTGVGVPERGHGAGLAGAAEGGVQLQRVQAGGERAGAAPGHRHHDGGRRRAQPHPHPRRAVPPLGGGHLGTHTTVSLPTPLYV